MKQVSHRGYLLVDFPEDAHDYKIVYVHNNGYNIIYNVDEKVGFEELPPGQWEIIGKGNEITEEVCKGVVAYDIHPMTDHIIGYTDYELDDDNVLCDSAKESMHSLIKSHGMKPSECLILKLKTNA